MDREQQDRVLCEVKHLITPSIKALNGALIPIGYYLHRDIQEVAIGSDITFFDGVGKLVSRCTITAPSPIADTICQLLYGRTSEDIYTTLKRAWKNEMYEDKLMLITFDIKYDKQGTKI